MRTFNAYEYNHLVKFGFDPIALSATVEHDIPVGYITNKVEFHGRIFNLSRDTLIPRHETEELIDLAISNFQTPPLKITFADIGTGSGAIGITFAAELGVRNITYSAFLSDISEGALQITKSNAKELLDYKESVETTIDSEGEIKIFKADLLQGYPKNIKLDVIFANLPYIPSGRLPGLDNSVKNYEPHSALDGGPDGLKYIRELLNQSPEFLSPNGIVLLEVDDSHTNASDFYNKWDITIIQDSNKKNRFWLCKLRN